MSVYLILRGSLLLENTNENIGLDEHLFTYDVQKDTNTGSRGRNITSMKPHGLYSENLHQENWIISHSVFQCVIYLVV